MRNVLWIVKYVTFTGELSLGTDGIPAFMPGTTGRLKKNYLLEKGTIFFSLFFSFLPATVVISKMSKIITVAG